MLEKKNYQFWFCTGSQDLYGEECLAHVAEHSKIIVEALNRSGNLPYEVIWKPTMITNEVIRRTFNEANTDELRRYHYLDAYVFSGKIMDPGLTGIAQTTFAFTYPVQPGDPI